jgi:transposase
MAGSTATLWSLSDLSPAISAMATRRSSGRHLMGALRGPAGAWRTGLGRGVCGCHLRGGKKGGDRIGPTRCGKGTKIMAIADSHGLPIAVRVTSASPNESTLVEATLAERHVVGLPERLIGDKAYDSDPLDKRLRNEGIELIAPNRRKRSKTQDGRPLRRYLRRWKVERLFAWLESRTAVRLAEKLPPPDQPLGAKSQ